MIVPPVEEPCWLESLRDLPVWNGPKGPMLVVAPHPDDETLGAGGLIFAQACAGREIVIAAVTDGERAYQAVGMTGLGELRRAEQTEALRCLGVPANRIQRLALPDSGVAQHERELEELLRPLVSSETHVLAPWTGDFHPDHEACGRAAEKIARAQGAWLSLYFFWTWHRGTPNTLAGLTLRKFELDANMLSAKTEALDKHATQLWRAEGEPILPERLLGPARRGFEVFASA